MITAPGNTGRFTSSRQDQHDERAGPQDNARSSYSPRLRAARRSSRFVHNTTRLSSRCSSARSGSLARLRGDVRRPSAGRRCRVARAVPWDTVGVASDLVPGVGSASPPMGRLRRVDSTLPSDETPRRGSDSAQKRNEQAQSRDEAAELRDEVADLRDEVAALRDTESDLRDRATPPSDGPDPAAGDGELLDQAVETRDDDAAARDRCAAAKDQTADQHDDDAAARDREAHERDEAAEERDRAARAVERAEPILTADDASSRADAVSARRDAASDRRRSEQDRLKAAVERTEAGVDRDASAAERAASASERHDAEQDRDGSATDRAEATKEIDAASLDVLTGTYTRGAGMVELERDLSRASRSGEPMTLAFVDVDDLKGTNDRGGHPAGDRLLRQVASVLTANTRPHDPIIRYGGDEFVCALIGLTLTEAADRLAEVNRALAVASERGSITVGLAELEAGESLDSLIRRADNALYHQRRQQ